MSVFTLTDLAPDTPVISAPFSLAITVQVALDALRGVGIDDAAGLAERELVCLYVALHWISDRSQYS